ncbi:MAG: OadG family protein [Clostridiales bacterium]|nr:OadG family protein [Clostridiales bacterium]MBP5653937.1 OadG family protein [Clostridiales bacterium]
MSTTLIQFAERGNVLSIPDALKNAGFTILVVFAVLCLIFIIISIAGKIFSATGKAEKPAAAAATPAAAPAAAAIAEEEFSSGSLRLKGCDEKTAAMIMAIVSDNTGIPLSELVFKSITLVEDK